MVAWRKWNKAASVTRIASGWKPSEAMRAKLSVATTAHMASGRVKKISAIEARVGQTLARMGLPLVPQWKFPDAARSRYFAADFYLPSLKTVIEVQGTFWHADPRVYPVPRHIIQIKRIEGDKRKAAALAYAGVRLALVWELDAKADCDAAVRNAIGPAHAEITD